MSKQEIETVDQLENLSFKEKEILRIYEQLLNGRKKGNYCEVAFELLNVCMHLSSMFIL